MKAVGWFFIKRSKMTISELEKMTLDDKDWLGAISVLPHIGALDWKKIRDNGVKVENSAHYEVTSEAKQ